MSEALTSGRTIKVRSFLGLSSVDMNLAGLNLIAGHNGVGKTSLLEAIACGALQVAKARGLTTKKSLGTVVREGAELGSITFQDGGSTVRIVYPDGEVEQLGPPVEPPSALGIGARLFSSLSPSDRLAELLDRFEAKPTLADFQAFLTQHEGMAPLVNVLGEPAKDGTPRKILDIYAAALHKRVQEQGWPAVEKAAREDGTKKKGKWEQISGRKYGSALAPKWTPEPMVIGETYSLVEVTAAFEAREQALESAIHAGGVNEGRRKELQDTADALANRQVVEDELKVRARDLAEKGDAVVARINAKDAPIDVESLQQCPNCNCYLRTVQFSGSGGAGPGSYKALEAVKVPPEAQREAQAKAAKADTDELARIRAALAENDAQQREQAKLVKASRDAQAELARVAGLPDVDQEEVDRQRAARDEAKRLMDAVKAYGEARKVHAEIVQHQAIIDALDPSGVRQVALLRGLTGMNTDLATVCANGKMKPVAITEECDLTYGGRSWSLLSKSERWRVDFAISLVLATREKAPLLLLDELDMIDTEARVGLLMALAKANMPAVIAMTARNEAALPKLRKAKIGNTFWLEGGAMRPANED